VVLTVVWERSPASRHSHVSVVIPSEQGLLYMFGGYTLSGGAGTVNNDMWAYDQASQGWEEVQFPATVLGCDLPEAQTLRLPPKRAGHGMVSMRTGAITCGGYAFEADGRTTKYLADDDGRMDCWWFTPGSPPRWDAAKMVGDSTTSPVPRHGQSMSYDTVESKVMIFGGKTLKGQLLNDCWILAEVMPPALGKSRIWEYQTEYKWTSCNPLSESSLKPQARYGHQSVHFHMSLYVVGGFAQDGLRVAAKQDIWILDFGHNTSWAEIMPTTRTPDPRGFHALWLSGFKIFLHGGQGPTGSGTAAVLGDTWQFDLFTKEWHQKASSAAVPIMSNLAINPLDNSAKAISFGGRDSSGNPSGRLYTFSASKATDSWERVYPAGVRPSRRTGNTLVYDQGSARIISSFGLDGSGMQEDTWILDLGTRMWKCWYGSAPTCTYPAPNPRYSGPGKIAFPSQVQAGLYSFLFGGARVDIRSCAEIGRSSTGNIDVASNVNEMWAMDTSTLVFLKVKLDTTNPQPKATFLSSMVAASEFSGFKQPLVLAGGADLSCTTASPPCTLPMPSNEVWVMDTARQESLGTGDNMAEFDGEDDMLQIVLPGWCNNVMMMNVLWIDSWLLVMSIGKVRSLSTCACTLFESVSCGHGMGPMHSWAVLSPCVCTLLVSFAWYGLCCVLPVLICWKTAGENHSL